jgi:hypothetical protein
MGKKTNVGVLFKAVRNGKKKEALMYFPIYFSATYKC